MLTPYNVCRAQAGITAVVAAVTSGASAGGARRAADDATEREAESVFREVGAPSYGRGRTTGTAPAAAEGGAGRRGGGGGGSRRLGAGAGGSVSMGEGLSGAAADGSGHRRHRNGRQQQGQELRQGQGEDVEEAGTPAGRRSLHRGASDSGLRSSVGAAAGSGAATGAEAEAGGGGEGVASLGATPTGDRERHASAGSGGGGGGHAGMSHYETQMYKRKLYPAGRILHLFPAAAIAHLPQQQALAAMEAEDAAAAAAGGAGVPPPAAAQHSFAAAASAAAAGAAAATNPVDAAAVASAAVRQPYVLYEIPDPQAYSRVKLCRTMVSDHLIPAYLTSLESVLEQLEARQEAAARRAWEEAEERERRAAEMHGRMQREEEAEW